MPKKPTVDSDACIGCGLCVGTCPAAFDFNEEGKAVAIGAADDAEIDEAIANCPVQAISE